MIRTRVGTPPADVRAKGFRHELWWTLRHNWAWYVFLAIACFGLGHFL